MGTNLNINTNTVNRGLQPFTTRMLSSYLAINNHDTYTIDQKNDILARLSEDYIVNTFGPDGLNKKVCDFFIYFENSNTTTPIGNVTPSTVKIGDTLRWNYGASNIYFQNNLPTQINNGVITVTSTDGFNGITEWRMYYETFKGNLFNLNYYCPLMTKVTFGGNEFSGTIQNLSPVLTDVDLIDNNFSGNTPSLTLLTNLVTLNLYNNANLGGDINYMGALVRTYDFIGNSLSDLSLTAFSRELITFRVQNNKINTTIINTLLDNLETYYSTNAPIRNSAISLQGVLMGFIDELNPKINLLKSYWTGAGSTLTFNYNKLGPLSTGMVAFTFDDVPLSIHDVGLPLFTSKGIKGTVYQTIEYIDTFIPAYNESACGWDELKDFAAAGWTVGSHSFNHLHLADVDEATLRTNLADSKAAFVTNAMAAPTHFAYPFGSYDALTTSIMPEYYESSRIASSINAVTKKVDELTLTCLNIDNYNNEDNWPELKELIDFANANNVGLIFLNHVIEDVPTHVRSISTAFMTQIIDYIQSLSNTQIVTIDELYTEMKS